MAEINPTRINQRPVDSNTEVSPDGVPLASTAAPTSAPRISTEPSPKGPIESMADLPKEDGTPAEPKIDFNTFKDAAAVDHTPLVDKTPKPDEKKEVEDTAPELKTGLETESQKEVAKETKANETPAPKVETPIKPAVFKDKQGLQPRDLTGIPDDLVEHLKNEMSRPAFEKVKPLIVEKLNLQNQVQELSKKVKQYVDNGVPESYYEHPNAFVLHPDYLSNLQTVDKAQTILNHWAQQSEAVKGGAATYQQIHVNPQTGELFTTEAKSDTTAESTIMRAMIFSQNQLMQQQASLQAFSKVHQERHSQAAKWADDFEHKDPAFQIFETAQNKEQFINSAANILKEFHPSFQSNPLARPLAKAKFVIATLASMLTSLQKQGGENGNGTTDSNGQPLTPQAQVRRAVNPTNANLGGHNTENPNSKPAVTVDMFNAIKEGY